MFSFAVSQRKWADSELVNSQLDSGKFGKLFPLLDDFQQVSNQRTNHPRLELKYFSYFNYYFYNMIVSSPGCPVSPPVVSLLSGQ